MTGHAPKEENFPATNGIEPFSGLLISLRREFPE